MTNAEYKEIDKRKIAINDKELSARLGRVCSHKDEDLFRVYETLMRVIDPRYAVARVNLRYTEDGGVDLGFTTLKSTALVKNLNGAASAYLVVCTLGLETDRLISKLMRTSRAEAFIFDAVASALAEAALDGAEEEIACGASLGKRFSPGYADLSLECQKPILDYLGAPIYLGVTLTDASLMLPQKTISAIIGILD